MERFKALIIGCGNIGAMYDFNTENIWSHAKAYSIHNNFSFDIYDNDIQKAEKVAKKYQVTIIDEPTIELLKIYDIVSICSPTQFHYNFLKMALEAKVKVIICEKPISYNIKELSSIEEYYTDSQSKILVNYFRRFEKDYLKLKHSIQTIMEKEQLVGISVQYHRGFMNNCSHAFDLIEFLTNTPVDLSNIKVNSFCKDHFNDDPTLSFTGLSNDVQLNFVGIENLYYSVFEISLFFSQTRVCISDGGKSIEFFENGEKTFSKHGILKNYMLDVICEAERLLLKTSTNDNFTQALQLNKRVLKITTSL